MSRSGAKFGKIPRMGEDKQSRGDAGTFPAWIFSLAGVVIVILLGIIGTLIWDKLSSIDEAIGENTKVVQNLTKLAFDRHPEVARGLLALSAAKQVSPLTPQQSITVFEALTAEDIRITQRELARSKIIELLRSIESLSDSQRYVISAAFVESHPAEENYTWSDGQVDTMYHELALLQAVNK